MADVLPEFDQLILYNSNNRWSVKYIVKSREINSLFEIAEVREGILNQLFLQVLEGVNLYIKPVAPAKGDEGSSRQRIVLLQIFDQSITIRTVPKIGIGPDGGILSKLPKPVRTNSTQKIGIPYSTIESAIDDFNFQKTVTLMVNEIDNIVTQSD